MDDYENQLWTAIPSQLKEQQWILIRSKSVFRMNLEVFDNNLIEYGGYWLLYSDNDSRNTYGFTRHDILWLMIRDLIRVGVTMQASCSTSACNPIHQNRGVIRYYTKMFTDKPDVRETAEFIRSALRYTPSMEYMVSGKILGMDPLRPFQLYIHTINNEFYERDVLTDPSRWRLVSNK